DTIAAASEIVMVAIEALMGAGLTGISVDFTLPDLVDTLAARDGDTDPDHIEAVRRELDTKDAGGLRDAGGEAYLPLLYAAGPFDSALADLRELDAGGALATRLDGLEAIAARIAEAHGRDLRLTLDPTERYGFEYQTWFGFTLYADALRGAAGRGGTYRIGGSEEAATGFTLYVDHLAEAAPEPSAERLCYLPSGYDAKAAARLRAEGWRTLAQLGEGEDAAALGCTHVLEGDNPKQLEQDR
ncbi:ATP phosphoribosyltransferase regulatory subunit, partial [Erythrobacter sp.]|uniref:ATP phosphoribosyltransferase regulatory subunit n=1 Tax=Erythrobacter sp. TaxID=1042 RepID=UPI002EC86776|nr:ATP phosphoribosyltransferase regulatory subunit [Erythrobacter sp.]